MIAWDKVPEYLPILLQGAVATIQVSVGALVLSVPLGLMWAFFTMSKNPLVRLPVAVLINVVRGMPMIVLLYYVYFVMPDLGLELTSMQSAIFGLALAYSAYLAEVFRAGIEGVDSGQMEAARSIGMGKVKAMRRVVFPQAFRLALPPFANMLVMLVKDSALASVVAVTEITRQGQLVASSTFDNTTVFTLVALLYLVMTLPLMQFTGWLEVHFGKHRSR